MKSPSTDKKKKGTGARMYELAEGVASSSDLFGHSQQTKVARQEEKRRLSQPIAERLQSSGRVNVLKTQVKSILNLSEETLP